MLQMPTALLNLLLNAVRDFFDYTYIFILSDQAQMVRNLLPYNLHKYHEIQSSWPT